MSIIKLLVFDENTEFREPLEQYTQTVPAIRLLGVKTAVQDAIDGDDAEAPDLVLFATALVSAEGEGSLSELRNKWPEALFYRLTVFDDSGLDEYDYIEGFDGSVPRSNIEEHLTAIIETFKCA